MTIAGSSQVLKVESRLVRRGAVAELWALASLNPNELYILAMRETFHPIDKRRSNG